MPAIIAALVAGGASFGQGMLTSHAQKKQQKRYKKRFSNALSQTEAIQGRSLGQQEALTRQATAQQLAGYDSARREAERMGRSSKQGLLDRETQLQGSLSQGLTNSGLGSTTRGANLSRGLAADTGRGIAGLNEGLAGMFGDLALGRAGAEAQGSQQLAGLAGQRGDLFSNLAQMRSMGQYYGASPWGGGGPMPEMPNSFGQNLLGGVQTGLGTFMGMGGGGGKQQGLSDDQIRWLFSGRPGSQGYGGQQPVNSGYYSTFTGG